MSKRLHLLASRPFHIRTAHVILRTEGLGCSLQLANSKQFPTTERKALVRLEARTSPSGRCIKLAYWGLRVKFSILEVHMESKGLAKVFLIFA